MGVGADRSGVPASLAEALDRAGWSPRALVRAVNNWLVCHGRGSERIDPTAAYSWVNRGYCPYEPLPEAVAAVLSERLGCLVMAADVWPNHPRTARNGEGRQTAIAGLGDAGTLESTTRALGGLAAGARPPPVLLPVSGVDLVAAAIDGLDDPVPSTGRPPDEQVLLPQAEVIADHVAALRRLDDRQGGGAVSLRYVTGELSAVLDLARCASYDSTVGRQLLAAVGDLAQLAGWMHWDADLPGAAQRYLLLSMRIARSIGDDGRAVNNAGMLSYIAAHSGQGHEAVQIAAAAAAAQVSARSRLLRARIMGRAATAHAAVGDLHAFRRAAGQAQELHAAAATDDGSPYLYYLNSDQLAAEAGQGLLTLARSAGSSERRLLAEAVDLLTPLSTIEARAAYQRSALLHSCFLAEVHIRRRDLDAAADVARAAVRRLPAVRSQRCLSLLHRLRGAFAQRKRAVVIADVLPELEDALERV